MKTLSAIALAGMVALSPLSLPAAEESLRPVTFNIEAQSLEGALNAFAVQTGLQVVYYSKVEGGLKAPAVSGKLSPQDALKQLLAGTALDYKFLNPRTVAIQTKAGNTTGMTAADQMRLAEISETTQKKAALTSVESDTDRNQMVVRDSKDKPKPFSDANADIPRTINDARPYYIFDAKTIEDSGATNVESFLKQRLTMNTTFQTNAQDINGFLGNTSTINLRGLGPDKTLILINGRKVPGITLNTTTSQPDLNGIPLNSIARIEVLPSSASGIYGGSAIGGVINVILKDRYQGGEVRVNFENAAGAHAPNRAISATYGVGLEDGKTNVMISGQWSDSTPLLLKDRRQVLDRSIGILLQNDPSRLYTGNRPFLGASPNIVSSNGTTPLVLKPAYGGMSLGSSRTFVPVGTAPGISASDLGAALLQNAGQWNFNLPNSRQSPTGLLYPVSAAPQGHSMQASIRRNFSRDIEAFVELSRGENRSESWAWPNSNLSIPASAASNPFTTALRVTYPSAYESHEERTSLTRSMTIGVKAQLPLGWIGQLDASRSQSRYSYVGHGNDSTAQNADIGNGTLNPFVDTLAYPLNHQKYATTGDYVGQWSSLDSFALRGSGPIAILPWGKPTLNFGLTHDVSKTPENVIINYTPNADFLAERVYFAREARSDSGYAEALIPLVSPQVIPGFYGLDMQLTFRADRYTVDSGTPGLNRYPESPEFNSYMEPTNNGLPFSDTTSYTSNNSSIGIRYQPMLGITLRASYATAFLPPLPSQLVPNPMDDLFESYVIDPLNQNPGSPPPECIVQSGLVYCPVRTRTGGNPSVKPQNSKSWNAGLIWEPQSSALKGLRINVEYYEIDQFDQIVGLGPQEIINAESYFPGRVTRDASGAATFIDVSVTNLFRMSTLGWDLSGDYQVQTKRGVLDLHVAHTLIRHEGRQLLMDSPLLEYAGFVGNGGPNKRRSGAVLNWQAGNWSTGWSTYYYGAYKQRGAAGNPVGSDPSIILAQGSETVPSQVYHDWFVARSFGNAGNAVISGLKLQLGIKNVFDSLPPFDAARNPYYVSSYGDLRLRSYWFNASKQF